MYAGVNGYLDKIPTSSITKFERTLLDLLKSKYGHILESIEDTQVVKPEIAAEPDDIIKDMVPDFKVKK